MSIPHAVQFYHDDVFLIDAVSAFIADGANENATIIVIAIEKHREELRNALQALGHFGIEDHIIFFDAIELLSSFMVDGWPDQTRFTSTIADMVERAAVRGPVRIFGEMVAVLWAEGKTRAAIRLEELWNGLTTRHASLLCAYPMSSFPDQKESASFLQVCQLHTHVHPAQ